MKLYLEQFDFPTLDDEWNSFVFNNAELNFSCYNNVYPFSTLPRHIRRLEFSPITILYGANGSGKTTMLNIIAERLGIKRTVKINKSSFMNDFVDMCSYKITENPVAQKIITSDDVFSDLFLTREKNEIIDSKREDAFKLHSLCNRPGVWIRDIMEEKIGDGNWLENIDVLQDVLKARGNSGPQFAKKKVGHNIIGKSNGETAVEFFQEHMREPGLYLLDEPENSLSAIYQKELAQFLFESARFFGAQLIISTHSPFMLSISEAKIYNLDAKEDVVTEDWTTLENMKEYYNLFRNFSEKFE